MIRLLIFLICLASTNVVFSQVNHKIISEKNFRLKFNHKLKYNVEYEFDDFKLYFTKNDLNRLLDTIKGIDDSLMDLLKKAVNNSSNSFHFNSYRWCNFPILKLNSLEEDSLFKNKNLLKNDIFSSIKYDLILNANFNVFDKVSMSFLKSPKIMRVIESDDDPYNSSTIESIKIGGKVLVILSYEGFNAQPAIFENDNKTNFDSIKIY